MSTEKEISTNYIHFEGRVHADVEDKGLNLGVLCQMFLLSHWSSGNGAEDSMSR